MIKGGGGGGEGGGKGGGGIRDSLLMTFFARSLLNLWVFDGYLTFYIIGRCRSSLDHGSRIIFKGLDKPVKIKILNGGSIVWIGGVFRSGNTQDSRRYSERLRQSDSKQSYHSINTTASVKENWVFINIFFQGQKEVKSNCFR